MSTKFKNLKNDLQDLEQEVDETVLNTPTGTSSGGNSKVANYILLFAFVATLLFYTGNRVGDFFSGINPIDDIVQAIDAPSEDIIVGMGNWMQDMGYGELTREQLLDLRSEGVTATYTSQIRDVGYEPTLEQLVELQRADVSATYARMMKELGYDLTIEQLAETRRNEVTAFFTSNMMDLGYTLEEMPVDKLIGMRSVGVSHSMAERLADERRERPTVDELIRYAISNQ